MSRFLLVNEATGAIVSTISAVSEAVALLHAGSGQAVLAMTQDRGGFINDATMKVEDGSLVTIEGGTTPAQFSDLILQEVSSPE